MGSTFWVETLGCPKNQVDSDKLVGALLADGCDAAGAAEDADLVVVNTCAFVEEARQESVDTILALADARRDGARLVVTGCLAERSGAELAEALPEVDAVAGFATAVPVVARPKPARDAPALDLLHLPRPGGDRAVGVRQGRRGVRQALRVLRHPELPRPAAEPLDRRRARRGRLARRRRRARGRPRRPGPRRLRARPGHRRAAHRPARRAPSPRGCRGCGCCTCTRSTSPTSSSRCSATSAVPYVDLSLQHVSAPLLRRMRRWGDGDRFLDRIERIRRRRPEAAFRSNFIVGYPGETEDDHDALLAFVEAAQLDWCGFFAFSEEAGTLAAGPGRQGAAGAGAGAAGRADRAPGPDHGARNVTYWSVRGSKCSWTRPAPPAATARRPRSTA